MERSSTPGWRPREGVVVGDMSCEEKEGLWRLEAFEDSVPLREGVLAGGGLGA